MFYLNILELFPTSNTDELKSERGGFILFTKFFIIGNILVGGFLYLWGIPLPRIILPSSSLSLIFSLYMLRLYKLHYQECRVLNYANAYKTLFSSSNLSKEQGLAILDERKDWFEEEKGIMIKMTTLTEKANYKSIKIEVGYKAKKNKEVKPIYFQTALYYLG